MIAGFATAEGTGRYASRFAEASANGFFRQAGPHKISSLGIGTYLGGPDEQTDENYQQALRAALTGGINFIDTSLNYRLQRSELSVGAALRGAFEAEEIRRDEVVVATKAGYLVPKAVPRDRLNARDIVGGIHSMAPAFLTDQLHRSLSNLGLETVDIFYLHNPETQAGHVQADELDRRFSQAFQALENEVEAGRIGYYGAATWQAFRVRPETGRGLSLERLIELATEVAGESHHFRYIQLPFNMAMTEVLRGNVLDLAARNNITVVASATLMQSKLARDLPENVASLLGGGNGCTAGDPVRPVRTRDHSRVGGDEQGQPCGREPGDCQASAAVPGPLRAAVRHPLPAEAMIPGEPTVIEADESRSELDEAIRAAPPSPAVFLIWPREGSPYLARTASLRRRLLRLLKAREGPSRLLNLRDVVVRVEYWLTASRLESSLTSWALGRQHFPDTYLRLLRLRMPPYVKLILTNRFPRTQVTRRLSGARSLFYGPFRSRTAAEHFEGVFLDLFQIRRCPEDLEPSPEHPGCIYGEMNRCLRPCQAVVGDEEYESEVDRVTEFLSSSGQSLLVTIAGAREKLSADLEFEAAAREHARYERVQQVLKLSDELAADIDRLHGVAVTRSTRNECVELRFMLAGRWLSAKSFFIGLVDGRPVPMDGRLRELASELKPPKTTVTERQEHLALLARWFYSSWRDGEWLPFERLEALPYRKLVNAIRRVASGGERS